jgi:GT2 family glycosyltransferase
MLSILIVTFNNERHIGPCLDSLPWADRSLEAVVVDNASSDRTLAEIGPRIKGRCAVLIANRRNRGYAEGMNQAMAASRGEWICLLGPDTRVRPEALSRLTALLRRNPAIGAAAPRLVGPDGTTQPSCRKFPTAGDALLEMSGLPRLFPGRFTPRWKMPGFGHGEERRVDQPEATCLLVRRAAAVQTGPMDPRFPVFFNDVDWCRRIRNAGWDIVFVPGAVVEHARGASVNQRPVLKIWKSHQGFDRYFRKYRTSVWGRCTNPALGFLLAFTAVLRSAWVMIIPPKRGR